MAHPSVFRAWLLPTYAALEERLARAFYGTPAGEAGPAARLAAQELGGARTMGVALVAALLLVDAPSLLLGPPGSATTLEIVLGAVALAASVTAASWILPRIVSGTALGTALTLIGVGVLYVGAMMGPTPALPHPELLPCFAPLVVMALVAFAPVDGRVVLTLAIIAAIGHVLAWRAGVLGGDRATRALALAVWVNTALAGAWLARRRRRALRAGLEREQQLGEQNVQLQDAHAQLVRAERLAVVGRLAGTVSHEIGNPLTAMHCCLDELCAAVEAANETYPDDGFADAMESLELVRLAVDRSTRYLQALREQARGLASVEEREVDLAHEIRSLVLLMSHAAARDGVTIEVDAPADLRVRTDPGKVLQVVAHLLENAVDATRGVAGARPVRISVRREDTQQLVIEVRDDGRGIDPSVRGGLFEQIVTTKVPNVGTGLGLGICQDNARQLGGTIEAHDLEPRGTAFVVRIPLPEV